MKYAAAALFALVAAPAAADDSPFTKGPVFEDFGPAADVDATFVAPKSMTLKLSYDVKARSENNALNRTLEAAARFINMNARAGVPLNKMQLAIVVHGGATFDVARDGADGEGGGNPNAELVAALVDKGVRIIVCGQSAAHYGVSNDDLLPGVEMALSAMTAHAVLQKKGYALNPF